jgi:hypothetical protein
MSWGYRVTIIVLGFVAFMTFMVVQAFRQDFDLVAEDYYARELKFQDQIDKQTNHNQLNDPISCTVLDEHLILAFPSELSGQTIQGELYFFRPSDAGKDVKMAIATNPGGVQLIDRSLLSQGYYKLQIDYSAGGSKYYSEKIISIP